jgi:hypothetical protein
LRDWRTFRHLPTRDLHNLDEASLHKLIQCVLFFPAGETMTTETVVATRAMRARSILGTNIVRDGDERLLLIRAAMQNDNTFAGASDISAVVWVVNQYLSGNYLGVATTEEGVARLWESCARDVETDLLRELLDGLFSAEALAIDDAEARRDHDYSSVVRGPWHDQWWALTSPFQFLDPSLRRLHRAFFVEMLSLQHPRDVVESLLDDWSGTLEELEETLDALAGSYAARGGAVS